MVVIHSEPTCMSALDVLLKWFPTKAPWRTHTAAKPPFVHIPSRWKPTAGDCGCESGTMQTAASPLCVYECRRCVELKMGHRNHWVQRYWSAGSSSCIMVCALSCCGALWDIMSALWNGRTQSSALCGTDCREWAQASMMGFFTDVVNYIVLCLQTTFFIFNIFFTVSWIMATKLAKRAMTSNSNCT